jgi:hypothetical protein
MCRVALDDHIYDASYEIRLIVFSPMHLTVTICRYVCMITYSISFHFQPLKHYVDAPGPLGALTPKVRQSGPHIIFTDFT